MHFEAELDGYFERLGDVFAQRARRRGGPCESSYRIAGHRVNLRCADQRLQALLTPALQHRLVDSDPAPALRIDVLEAEDGEDATSVPAALRHAAAAVVSPACSADATPVYTHVGQRYRVTWCAGPQQAAAIDLLDLSCGRAIVCLQLGSGDRQPLPLSAPLRSLLGLWFEHHGMTLAHAAAVGTPLGGALVTGKSGCGKSTVALACLRTGLSWAGDDSLLLEANGAARIHSLYCSGSVSRADLHRYDALRGLPLQPGPRRDKAQFFLGARAEWLIEAMPLRAILVPAFTAASRSSIEPTSTSRTLLALAPSSVNLAGGRVSDRLVRLAAVVRATPCFTLHLSRDIADLPRVVAELLHRVGAGVDGARA